MNMCRCHFGKIELPRSQTGGTALQALAFRRPRVFSALRPSYIHLRYLMSFPVLSTGIDTVQKVSSLICHDLASWASQQHSSLRWREAPLNWSVKSFKVAMERALHGIESFVYYFVVELDKIVDRNLNILVALPSRENTKLCAFSRPEPTIKTSLQDYSRLRVQNLTRDDMMCSIV